MTRTERQAAVFLALAAYVGGSVVAASVLSPAGDLLRAAVFPGVFYLAAIRTLAAFAAIASVGPAAMNALYAAAAYVGWCLAGYLLGVRGLGYARGELKAVALAFPGVLGVLASAALLVVGLLGAVGAVAGPIGEALTTTGFVGLAFAGGGLWVPSLAWLSRVRTRQFGWNARPLERVDAAVELVAYAILLAGLALVGVAVALAVGPQYLVVSVLLLLVVAVTVVVPTGGAREPGAGY